MPIQLKRGAVPVPGTNAVVEGLHFRILVWAKSGTCKWRKGWHRLTRELGVEWSRVGERPESGFTYEDEDGNEVAPPPVIDHGYDAPLGVAAWETCYEVWGAPGALEELTSGCNNVVLRWEYAVAPARQPMTTIGREGRKHAPKKKHHPKNSGVFRWYDREHLATHRKAYREQLIAGCCGLDPNK